MVVSREFVALISRWNGRWDVYVLDWAQALVVDQTAADGLGDVERGRTASLFARFGTAALQFLITVYDGRGLAASRTEPRAEVPHRPVTHRPTAHPRSPRDSPDRHAIRGAVAAIGPARGPIGNHGTGQLARRGGLLWASRRAVAI